MASVFISLPHLSWREPVATVGLLPATGNQIGDAIITQDTLIIYTWNGSSWVALTDGGSPGTVTSVGLTDGILFSVSGSPVTTSGTLALSLLTQGANLVFAGPTSGAAAQPSFRSIVNADIPASLALTGIPTAPTASVGTSTTQLATTAFVLSQGFTGATGSMPSAQTQSTSVVTSATTTYVTAISTSITTTASSAPVYAKATATFTVTGAVPTVLKYRISINGVAGQEQLLSLTAVTTNYTAAVQYISASLAAGTYTVTFDIARNSGTGTVSFFEGTLDAIALQGTSSNGITSISGLGLSVGPGSGAQSLTGVLSLAGGGTNTNLTAVNGGIVYGTAAGMGLSAAGATGQLLRSAGAAAPTWTTATFPVTTTINQLLYSSAANVISGLATANTGALVTSNTGVPSIVSGTTANRLLRTNGTTVSFAQAILTTDVTGTLPFGNGGTGSTSIASGRVPFSNGTALITDGAFLYDTATNRLTVGTGGGTGTLNVVPVTSSLGLNVFSQTGNHAIQVQNQAAEAIELINASAGGAGNGVHTRASQSRGTLTARTQSLSGDNVWDFSTLGYTGATFGTNSSATMTVLFSENYTATNQGAEMYFSTAANGTSSGAVEHLRITNAGDLQSLNSHTKSTQTSPPTVAAGVGAGTGASAALSNATDTAGNVQLTAGTILLTAGAQVTVTFNRVYGVAPIVIITPTTSGTSLISDIYVSSTTGGFTLNAALALTASASYAWNYHVIETQ